MVQKLKQDTKCVQRKLTLIPVLFTSLPMPLGELFHLVSFLSISIISSQVGPCDRKHIGPNTPATDGWNPASNPGSVPAGAQHLPHKGPGKVIVGKTGLEISSSCHLFHV